LVWFEKEVPLPQEEAITPAGNWISVLSWKKNGRHYYSGKKWIAREIRIFGEIFFG